MEINANSKCPHCGKDIVTTIHVEPTQLAPVVRGNIRPASSAMIYRISSADMKTFLIDKARKIVSDVKMEVLPRYCEKKRQRGNEPHRSYASLRIAFSNHAVEKNDAGWFGKIGQGDDANVVQSLMDGFIRRYQFHRDDINDWLKNYKTLEKLEDNGGITEAYLNDLKEFASPRSVPDTNGDTWIVFAAAAEKVIADMLTVEETNKPSGRICIHDVIQISKDTVEFLVYVYPEDFTRDDPLVRAMLLGEEKVKKN